MNQKDDGRTFQELAEKRMIASVRCECGHSTRVAFM
jgi:hypothetical protein